MRGGYPASALAPGRAVLRAVLETGLIPTLFLLPDACSTHQLKMPLWRSAAGHQTKKNRWFAKCGLRNEDIAGKRYHNKCFMKVLTSV
jgi:hypothetical protein